MKLDVLLFDEPAGTLTNAGGPVVFQYHRDYVTAGGQQLSISLPLQADAFGQAPSLAYFGNLLPDGEYRELIAESLRVPSANSFALLAEIGRDCAGAVVLLPEGEDRTQSDPPLELSEPALAERLARLRRRSAAIDGTVERMSLAGAQAKLAVIRRGESTLIPRSWKDPTTHILKPQSPRFGQSVENEGFCMALARQAGLLAAPVTVERAAATEPYLSITRFDRDPATGRRLHQEDFCQALGIAPEHKYQDHGGPSIGDLFRVIDAHAAVPARDKLTLWRSIVFNFLIGNCDAHGKNFSLLHASQRPTLAPLYDLVSTDVCPLTKRLAMAIGDARELPEVAPRHFAQAAEEAGLTVPSALAAAGDFAGMVAELAGNAPALRAHDSSVVQKIRSGIAARAEILRRG